MTGRTTPRPRVGVFIDPLTDRFSNDRLFGEHPYGDYHEHYRHAKRFLETRGIPVHTGDFLLRGEAVADLNLYVTTGLRSRHAALAARDDVVLSAFVVHECPIVNPPLFDDLFEASKTFKRMYAFANDEALRPFLRGPVSFRRSMYPVPSSSVAETAWTRRDRRFLVMINANKVPPLKTQELYTERLRAVEYFGRHGEIDLYGFGWEGPPFRVGESRIPTPLRNLRHRLEKLLTSLRPDADPLLAAARRAHRGTASSKTETLSGYRFAICFENMVLDGWVTEKIFDCLVAGTVPVYLGAPDIERWVAPECFIDMRRFSSYDELRAYLHGLAPVEIEAYREAGRAYFQSEQYRPFTKQAFAEIFGEIVAEDTGVAL